MSTDIRVRFGARVRHLRKQRGWTQAEMADRLGIDRSYLADIERGKRNVALLNIQVIAEGFGMTIAQLFARL